MRYINPRYFLTYFISVLMGQNQNLVVDLLLVLVYSSLCCDKCSIVDIFVLVSFCDVQ